MRGRQILYLRSGCDSNPFKPVLLRGTSTAPAVHRPCHERRFLVGVDCPQRGHYRREPRLLHDALHPVLGHRFGDTHPAKIGICSFPRCEAAGSRRDEGAVRVVTNPSRTGVTDCCQDPSSVGCRDVNHKCMQLRHGSHRAACSPRITRDRAEPLLIPPTPMMMGMYTDWGNPNVVSRGAWKAGVDPAAQRCATKWAHWGRPFLR